jgi:anti-sigma B factor antagonist
VLVAANNTARRHRRAVHVSHAWGIVHHALEITGVLPYLTTPSTNPSHPVATASDRSFALWLGRQTTGSKGTPMNLSIDKHVNGGVVRLAVAGEVDLASCDHLRIAIKDCLADARTAELIVDLDRVTFLDSSGIRTLIQGRDLATGNGITYLVTNPNDIVHRVLEITGVLDLISLVRTANRSPATGAARLDRRVEASS